MLLVQMETWRALRTCDEQLSESAGFCFCFLKIEHFRSSNFAVFTDWWLTLKILNFDDKRLNRYLLLCCPMFTNANFTISVWFRRSWTRLGRSRRAAEILRTWTPGLCWGSTWTVCEPWCSAWRSAEEGFSMTAIGWLFGRALCFWSVAKLPTICPESPVCSNFFSCYRTEGETDDIFAAILSLFIDIASLRLVLCEFPV